MQSRPLHHRNVLALAALSLGAFVALSFGSSSFAATSYSRATRPSLAGTWSGRYSGSYSGTFTLKWKQTGTRLSGSIKLSRPSGTYPITGSVNRSKISFGAVGAGATYTGSWSGKSMSGRYTSADGGGGGWSAHRTS
jgi:hypothetical protein